LISTQERRCNGDGKVSLVGVAFMAAMNGGQTKLIDGLF